MIIENFTDKFKRDDYHVKYVVKKDGKIFDAIDELTEADMNDVVFVSDGKIV